MLNSWCSGWRSQRYSENSSNDRHSRSCGPHRRLGGSTSPARLFGIWSQRSAGPRYFRCDRRFPIKFIFSRKSLSTPQHALSLANVWTTSSTVTPFSSTQSRCHIWHARSRASSSQSTFPVITFRIPITSGSKQSWILCNRTTSLTPTCPRGLRLRPTSLSEDSFTAFQRALTACYRISKSRSKFELSIFVSCVFLLVLLCVGSAWIPFSWINPIIVLLSTALAWLGTTMLYSGFIFGNWERRALTTIIEELELVQQVTRREATSPLEVAEVVS